MGQEKDGLETVGTKCGGEVRTVGWDEMLRDLYQPVWIPAHLRIPLKQGFYQNATMRLSYVLTIGCQAASTPSTLSPAFYIETKKVSRHYQIAPRNKWTLG